eukprot:CAMPEP_0172941774 /NCGR_PEP_ID=MMETSP1075-20121228/224711_1 /TAXON_ID=2916 /ORGANISM="Ceratium fusus, Strain PA161109" /LENGTH=65 /DNA_ID=CAMNT_0013803189 /DNA_START=243 /DNA_END=440 /DNA_ORIENTATION=-
MTYGAVVVSRHAHDKVVDALLPITNTLTTIELAKTLVAVMMTRQEEVDAICQQFRLQVVPEKLCN